MMYKPYAKINLGITIGFILFVLSLFLLNKISWSEVIICTNLDILSDVIVYILLILLFRTSEIIKNNINKIPIMNIEVNNISLNKILILNNRYNPEIKDISNIKSGNKYSFFCTIA